MPSFPSSGRSRASRVVPAALVLSALAVVVAAAACGNSDDSPGLVSSVGKGQGGGTGTGGTKDSGAADATLADGAAGDDGGVDAGVGCTDKVKDNLETDVDCGGTVCPACVDGKACKEISDCTGMGCTNNICVTPTCSDKILNEDETDTDCGGKICPHCTVGRKCAADGDCSSGACTTGGACACPTGMVIVPQAELLGGAYCIDVTEVTKGAYNDFLTANYPIANQVEGCGANASYTPTGDWPPTTGQDSNVGFPVRDVDWCDAYAFCKHATKELCGNIGGGKLPDGLDHAALDRAKSDPGLDAGTQPLDAWYNACSAQGVNVWPYDVSTFNGLACYVGQSGPQPWADTDTSNNPVNLSCNGGIFGLYQMSGNVAEWENACSGTTGSSDTCSVRGGAFDSPYTNLATTDLQCDWQADDTRQRVPTDRSTLADVGFRCCQY